MKNTSAIPLRAAYLHGPYTLYTACYSSKFDPNHKYDRQSAHGIPQFEPYLKAGGTWDAILPVPGERSVTWVIEIVSQVVFSDSAAVHFELLVGRDEKSVDHFSVGGAWTRGFGPPAKFHEHWSPKTRGKQVAATKGVYSKSVTLLVDDSISLWNSPPLPSVSRASANAAPKGQDPPWKTEPENVPEASPPTSKKKKIHLVVLTHGLHSNLGADMLYLKESIDAASRKPKEASKANASDNANRNCVDTGATASAAGTIDEEDEEQVIVRGFSGNAVRTERGIQYLGKRLAKYVLLMTYPDQPYFPLKDSKSRSFSRPFTPSKTQSEPPLEPRVDPETHASAKGEDYAYRITSISFIGHSLGGLIQTYAIAYIQKHTPQFFDQIKPVNFIALATPFLGLSNENPVYVRFALDLGLVGRTGQDLGLSWTAPNVRSGWGAIIAGRGELAKDQGHTDPGAKPLLRILPCGPAHEVLHKFQRRTIYSNVVNDGIVPLRTSCLLFLDWKGLDRVEKARRDNGLVGTMAEWGWAELTGANSKSPVAPPNGEQEGDDGAGETGIGHHGFHPVARASQLHGDIPVDEYSCSTASEQILMRRESSRSERTTAGTRSEENPSESSWLNPLNSFFSIFRPKEAKSPPRSKHVKIYKRTQTLGSLEPGETPSSSGSHAPSLVRGNSLYEDDALHTPPKTTFFESAGDLLMPPLPPTDFILDPASRPRTIFHDRIYHPGDIPPPLPVKRRTVAFGSLQNKDPNAPPVTATQLPPGSSANGANCESGLKVEEKIARAYHRGLSWRKVLVRLEPDAHNNIMVRRMFTNAHGWPVVKHLVDTHFGSISTTEIADSLKQNVERAKSPNIRPTSSGDEIDLSATNTDGGVGHAAITHGRSETFPMETGLDYSQVSRQNSARWSDREIEDVEDDDFEEDDAGFRWSRR